jgi:two-component system response regulator DesR
MQSVRVLLVEDSEVYRASLELLLGLQDGIEVVGAVPTGADAVAVLERLQPDVAVVDLRLPGLGGVETSAQLRETSPTAAVVCLTAEACAEERDAVIAAGALAVIRKERPIEGLARTILDAAASVERA